MLKPVLTTILVSVLTCASADENVSTQLTNILPTISAVDIYLGPPNAESRQNYGVSDVMHFGCRLTVRDPVDINSLNDVLRGLKLEKSRDQEIDGRLLIRMQTKTGEYALLLMAYDEPDMFSHGLFNGIPVVSENFEKSIRAWAANHMSLATKACHR